MFFFFRVIFILKQRTNTVLFFIPLVFFIFLSTYSYGQSTTIIKVDSLKKQLQKDSAHIFRPRKVFPMIASDQRNSYLYNNPVNIWGIKAGVTLFDRHNLGIGAYSLKKSHEHKRIKDGVLVNSDLSMQYLTVFYEYSFIQTRWWELGVPVEIGTGNYSIKNSYASNNMQYSTIHGNIVPLGAAVDIYFKPTRWFGINVTGGYRYVLSDRQNLNFNGWFYSFGAAIYVRQILQDIRYYNKKRIYKRAIANTGL